VTLFYADSSALVRAYFADEPDHAELRSLLLERREPVVMGEISRLELAGAIRAASPNGRFSRAQDLLARIDSDPAEDGVIIAVDLRPESILRTAYRIVLEHRPRPLDAIHVAVCAEECLSLAGDDEISFVTRDSDQAKAASALGSRSTSYGLSSFLITRSPSSSSSCVSAAAGASSSGS
jgi:predicted nucleic acid-binding protein